MLYTDPTGTCIDERVPLIGEPGCHVEEGVLKGQIAWIDFANYSADVVQGMGSPGAWAVDQFFGIKGWDCIWQNPSIGKRLGITFTGAATAGGIYKYAVASIAQPIFPWLVPASAPVVRAFGNYCVSKKVTATDKIRAEVAFSTVSV